MNMHQNIMFIFIFLFCFKWSVKAQTCSGSNSYYYYTPTGKVTSQSLTNCRSQGLRYFLKCECRDNCYEYYKRIFTSTTSTYQAYDVICYDTILDAFDDKTNVKYCDPYQKICWQNLPTDETYYIKKRHSSTPAQFEVIKICPN